VKDLWTGVIIYTSKGVVDGQGDYILPYGGMGGIILPSNW